MFRLPLIKIIAGVLLASASSRMIYAQTGMIADTITMTNDSEYVPTEVSIKKGQIVVWKNTSDLIHTVTCDPGKAVKDENVSLPESASPFDSGRLDPQEAFSKQFNVPGTYIYFCIPHEMLGMVGKIIVEEESYYDKME